MFGCAVIFFASLALVYGQSTEVSQCISHGGELPIHTEVVGCTTPPCQLPQLQDVTLNIVFKAPQTMNSMRTVVTAYLSLGIITLPVPYDLEENSYTCAFLSNTYCPVMKDEVVQYQLRMFIAPTFPVGTSTTLEFRINNEEDNEPFLCIRVPVQIVAAIPTDTRSTKNETLTHE